MIIIDFWLGELVWMGKIELGRIGLQNWIQADIWKGGDEEVEDYEDEKKELTSTITYCESDSDQVHTL